MTETGYTRRIGKAMILGLTVVLLLVSACVPLDKAPAEKKKSPRQRLDRLVVLNDYSERSFAYHQFCIRDEPLNETFLANFKIIANLLFDEFVDVMDWDPQYTVDKVMERRKKIQHALKNHYMTEGCQSQEGREAKNYYEMLSQQDRQSIEEHLAK